jgi:hypothetical protein
MGDFFDFGFDSNLNFDFQMPAVEDYDTYDYSDYAYQGSDYDAYQPELLSFDFQPSAFELQGPVWDANSWLQETAAQAPTYSLGGGFDRPGQISHYDPSTGVYFDTAGNPVQPQSGGPVEGPMTPGGQVAGIQDPEAFARQGAYSQSPFGGGSAGGYGGAAGAAAGAGAGLVAGRPGQPGAGGDGGWMDTINSFLKSPLGGLLGAAGVGAAGLGIGKALAGGPPKTPQPQLAPGSPINAAGQNTMAQFYADQAGREAGYQAEQAPGYQGIRNQAMTLIPGQLQPVTVDQYQDPVQQAMQAELLATMQGGATPMVEEQLRKDWATLQNTMYRQLGNNPDWQMSSPGQEAINSFNRNAAIARQQSKDARVAAYAPGEGQRQQWGYQAPVEKARALGGEQRAYVDTLSRTSALGRMDPASLQAGLGGQPDQYRAMMTGLGAQAGMAGYGAAQQDRQQTMAGVGGIAGTVAGQIGSYGNADRIAQAIKTAQGTTPKWDTWGAPAPVAG